MERSNLKILPILLVLLVLSYVSLGQGSLTLENGTDIDYRVLTNDVIRPWEILWGPDDLLWVTEKGGDGHIATISRIDPGNGSKEVLYTAQDGLMAHAGTGGLLGMAFHPNFDPSNPGSDPSNGTDKLYITYTASDFTQHLAVMTFDGTTLSSPTTLVSTTLAPSNHGSRLIVTNDDKLLWTTGSDGSNNGGQQLDNLIGKVLRVNLDGTIPSDNPFVNDASALDEIYSYGHRNAQGIIQVPSSDAHLSNYIYSLEHGATQNDELNRIIAGHNYGWNSLEGYCTTTDPTVNDCPKVTFDLAPTGLLWYDHPAIPEWRRTLLGGTSKGSVMVRFRLDNSGEVINKDTGLDPANNVDITNDGYYFGFANGDARPRALVAAPNGKIYVTSLSNPQTDGSDDYIFVIENQSFDGCPADAGDPCQVFAISSSSNLEICDAQSFSISLPASARRATYEVLQNGNATGITLDGNGCALNFSITPNLLLQNNLSLSNGDVFTIRASDGTCTSTMTGSVSITINNVFSPRFFSNGNTHLASTYEDVTLQWYDDNGLIAGETNATYTGVNNPRPMVSSCGCDVWASSASTAQENIFGYHLGNQFVYAQKLIKNLDVPWSINYEQDDHIWITERDRGEVIRIDPSDGSQTVLLTLGSSQNFDNASRAGLMGMDINWTSNPPEVFVSYTYNSGSTMLRVAKYEYNESTNSLENATTLVENIPQVTNFGSDVLYLDGSVYVSTGSTTSQDANNGAHRQDNLIGKIMRIDVANPQTTPADLIFSFGHRNPQGIVNTPDGKIYSSEHGEAGAVDEVNLIQQGLNYGWPFHEGTCTSSSAENECPELLFGTAPGGIAYYPSDGNITALRNSLLMSNLKGQNVSVISLDNSYNVVSTAMSSFGRVECGPQGRLRDVTVDPTGNVYLLTNGTNPGIVRISVDPDPNIVPDPPLSAPSREEGIIVYPNPAQERLQVMFSESRNANFEITDMSGKRIIRRFVPAQASNPVNIDISSLFRGVYLLKIESEGRSITKKFLKN